MVIIPRVGKADVPSPRAEPVARLRAMAAHQGLTVFDLSDTFDQIDPAKLEIAAWDDHPNVIGHHRLFLALARASVKDQEVYRLLFSPENDRRRPIRCRRRSPARCGPAQAAGEQPPACDAVLPRLDKIVVWDQDDHLHAQ